MATEDWDVTFPVNTHSTMSACREALRVMASQGGGSIINTAPNLALQGNVIQATYSASKEAVIQKTRSIATNHGNSGIHANAVLPSLTRDRGSPVASARRNAREGRRRNADVLTWWATDIAHLVAFLASDEVRNMPG